MSRDWGAVRYKPEPDEGVIKLHDETTQSLLAAAGVPIELATSAEGTATREAWRRFLHATIQPLGLSVVSELRRKLSGVPTDRLRQPHGVRPIGPGESVPKSLVNGGA